MKQMILRNDQKSKGMKHNKDYERSCDFIHTNKTHFSKINKYVMEGDESKNHELCPLTMVRNKFDSSMFISTIGGGEIDIGFRYPAVAIFCND